MIFRNSKVLGIELRERSARVAQVRVVGNAKRVERTAEFKFPDGLTWQEPEKLGRALGEFLRKEHFAARRAVFGLAASALMAREISIPPAAPDVASGIVKIQAERAFSSDAADLVVDYADAGDAAQARPALLVAAQREKLEQVKSLAQGARLKLLSVTASALAAAAAFRDESDACRVTLLLSPEGSDVAVRIGSQFRALRALPAGAPPEGIATELFLMMSGMACNVSGRGKGMLTIWNESGASAESLQSLGTNVGLDVDIRADAAFAAAAALATTGANAHRAPIDLLHTHFEPAARMRFGARRKWATGIGAAAAILLLSLLVVWQVYRSNVAALTAQLAGMNEEIQATSDRADKLAYSRGWYSDRPRFMDCLAEMASAFPPEAKVWATNITIKPAPKGLSATMTAKSADEKTALEVVDRLKKSKSLGIEGDPRTKPALLYMLAGGRSREISFAVSFTFAPAE